MYPHDWFVTNSGDLINLITSKKIIPIKRFIREPQKLNNFFCYSNRVETLYFLHSVFHTQCFLLHIVQLNLLVRRHITFSILSIFRFRFSFSVCFMKLNIFHNIFFCFEMRSTIIDVYGSEELLFCLKF